MALGRVVAAATKSQGSLKKLIRKTLVREESVPFLDSTSYLRVSALADLCPREEVLASSRKIVRTRKFDADLLLIFAHGTALHWGLQNHVVGDTGALLGVWHCVDCAKRYGKMTSNLQESQSLAYRPKVCECGCPEFIYREQKFKNEEYRIGGHPDGFLVLPGLPGLGIAEFKSVGPKHAWEVKHAPNIGHVVQVQTYLWLTGLKWGIIMYWEKAGQGMTALSEHVVWRDENAVTRIKNTVQSIWNGVASEIPPERICTKVDCPRALKCPLKDLCFSGPR